MVQQPEQLTKSEFYTESGNPGGVRGPLVTLGAGLAAAVVGGGAYACLDHYVPFVFLNLLFVAGVGFMVGTVNAWGGRAGHVRNRQLVGAIAGLCSVAAWIAAWAVWLRLVCGTFPPVAVVPRLIEALAARGVWSVEGYTPTGLLLYACWAVELGIIVYLAVPAARRYADGHAYCERCHQWNIRESHVAVPPDDTTDLLVGLADGDLSILRGLPRAARSRGNRILVELTRCPVGQHLFTLTVKEVFVSKDDEGKKHEVPIPLLEDLIISREEHYALQVGPGSAAPATTPPSIRA